MILSCGQHDFCPMPFNTFHLIILVGIDDKSTPCNVFCSAKLPKYPGFALELLHLAKEALTGSLMDDELGRCNGGPGGCALSHLARYNHSLRLGGDDWPVAGHTMVGHKRLDNIKAAIESVVSANIPGDFAELGVWRGGASIYARLVMKCLNQNHTRRSLVFDAFETMRDLKMYMEASSYLSVTEDEVRRNFAKYEVLEGTHFYKGFFSASLPRFATQYRTEGRNIAVLRIDGNFYASYQDALYELYDFVPVGGIVIFDDVLSHPEVMKFWMDFTKDYSMTEKLHAIDDHSAWFRKRRAFELNRAKYQQKVDGKQLLTTRVSA